MDTRGPGIIRETLKNVENGNAHYGIWNIERNMNNVKNEKCTH